MSSNMKAFLLIVGLTLWSSVMYSVEALRLPTAGQSTLGKRVPVRKVRWGLNQERLYRLPDKVSARILTALATQPEQSAELEVEKSRNAGTCTCGQTPCREKKLVEEGEKANERIYGGAGYGGYQPYPYQPYPYGPEYEEYYEYDPYHNPYLYETYDPYYRPYTSYW